MPFTVKFDPTSVSKQAAIIPDATETTVGLVTLSTVRALAAANRTVFVFRPGAAPPLASNVYNDWATLMAACDAVQGLRTIEFDDSIVSPCVVPAGTWNMDGVFWTGSFNTINPGMLVKVVEGVVLLKFREIGGAINITFTGTTPPVTDFVTGKQTGINLREASSLQCTGAGPFIRNSVPGAVAAVSFDQFGRFVAGASPVFDIAAGSAGIVAVFDVGNVEPNTISGAPGSQWVTVVLASSGFIDMTQPAFLGTVNNNNLSLQRLTPSSSIIVSGTYSASRNEIVQCNLTTSNSTVVLPPAFNARGMWVVVKNINTAVPTGAVTIAPTGGDTVDSSPTGLLDTALQSRTYVSDGVSNWMAI